MSSRSGGSRWVKTRENNSETFPKKKSREAFAKAFRNLHKFNPEYAFSTWLFRIATNNCIDFIRKNKIKTMSIDSAIKIDNGDEITIDFKDNNLNPQETAIKNHKIEIMQYIVSKLPDKYQRLVTLRYFD